eukprot:gnl/TRDRNA2_/TRDRNA2_126655_c1_seq1.p1 gnl/TRDRNA2_/TRDRNA2_126655_c1~~gnl/TRDRNA2_/TRDRNA2_126655_c1_seq1.p1  ORF type:complete len:402 (-),score=73.00 gnl/TRDRNA2_/TRDRNA2_126655_c1_seq1:61-1116(-)
MGGNEATVVQESSILATTFTHWYNQVLNNSCYSDFPSGANTCTGVWKLRDEALAFTADVEQFTVLIDHSVLAPDTGLTTTSRNMVGVLFVDAGHPLQDALCASRLDAVDAPGGSRTDKAPCYLTPEKTSDGLDYFHVGLLLEAMGISLEQEAYPGSGHSARYEGLTVNMLIDYTNTAKWHGVTDISYVYKPRPIPFSTYKTTRVTSTSYPDSRVKADLHGILFEVQAGGSLAVFDPTSALVQLTTSLTLLAMSAVMVNLLAQYVLQRRSYYKEALCERTADFDGLAHLEDYSDEQLDRELQARHIPTGGSRERKVMRLLEDGWMPPAASFQSASGAADDTMQRPLRDASAV